jgi:hypothetical protein
VGQCVATGCLTTLADGPHPTRLAIGGANVFFTTCDAAGHEGSVRRVPIAGGGSADVATGTTCPTDLALHGDAVYVAGLHGDGISRVPAGGGNATTVVDANGPLAGIAVDGAAVYATTAGAVVKAPLQGGGFTTLATVAGQRSATRPVLDEQNVYWGDPGLGAVYRVAKDGGEVAVLTSGLGGVDALALAGSDLYVGAGYVIVKIAASGGAPVTLGTAAGAEVLALTVDETGVYFTSSGVVWTLPLAGGTLLGLATARGDLDAIATSQTDLFWTASPACDASQCEGHVQRLSRR